MAFLKLSFDRDLTIYLKERLIAAGYDDVHTVPDDDIAYRYFGVIKRRPSARPRCVLISKTFSCAGHLRAGLTALDESVTTGRDLKPYLSRKLKESDYNDGLLNDWGVLHFHLGTQFQADGFVKRTKEVLLARVEGDAFYELLIGDHTSFDDQELVEIMHSNWPESIARYRLRAVGLETKLNREESCRLRKAGVTLPFVTRDGTVYALLGGGIATSTDSMQVTIERDRLFKMMRQVEAIAASEADRILRELGVQVPTGSSAVEVPLRMTIENGDMYLSPEEGTSRMLIGRVEGLRL